MLRQPEPLIHLGMVHGRFQPFHRGHLRYFEMALGRCDHVIAGITNPDAPAISVGEASDPQRHRRENNPFTFDQRRDLIAAALRRQDSKLLDRVKIIPFDVSTDPRSWPSIVPSDVVQLIVPHEPWDAEKARRFEAAGYRVVLLPTEPNRVTATLVRSMLRSGDERWRELVPDGVAEEIDAAGLISALTNTKPNRSPERRKVSQNENDSFNFWEQKQQRYAEAPWITVPNTLAQQAVQKVRPGSRVLDLGCGQGADALLFAAHGCVVSATDLSAFALERFREPAEKLGVVQHQMDLAELPYPFEGNTFDVVYAHLALHYFNREVTTKIFDEVARLMTGGGELWALFNSVRDPEATAGATRIEERFFELSPGDRKRYFTVEELSALLPPTVQIVSAEYGRGTNKNPDDEYVKLIATKKGM